jgi:hypothetical protein
MEAGKGAGNKLRLAFIISVLNEDNHFAVGEVQVNESSKEIGALLL